MIIYINKRDIEEIHKDFIIAKILVFHNEWFDSDSTIYRPYLQNETYVININKPKFKKYSKFKKLNTLIDYFDTTIVRYKNGELHLNKKIIKYNLIDIISYINYFCN